MMVTSKLLRELTRGLKPHDVDPGGLFRVFYALRNPGKGCGFGIDGVDDLGLIGCYVEGLERAYRLLRDEWGWPRPRVGSDGCVPVYVMHTAKLGEGDIPLTLTGEVERGAFESKLFLRSTFDEPRPAVRDEKARVEAVHEASHVFTHQFVPRGGYVGDLWAWFDEATAVFIEGACYGELPESRRFGIYWSRCPEYSLATWGDYDFLYGGYFAAWFVRYLVKRFGPALLLEIWQWGEKSPEARGLWTRGRRGPMAAITERLEARGTSLKEVFWDYCRSTYADEKEFAPGLAESYGTRSLTESFTAPDGPGEFALLPPLACRYYQIHWPEEARGEPVEVRVEGAGRPDDFRAAVLTVGPDGRVLGEREFPPTDPSARSWTTVAEPPPSSGHTAVVLARVEPVPDERPATLTQVRVRVSVGRPADGTIGPGLGRLGIGV